MKKKTKRTRIKIAILILFVIVLILQVGFDNQTLNQWILFNDAVFAILFGYLLGNL